MSLAELISQHQNTGSSIKARTNRFWSYIGNNRTYLASLGEEVLVHGQSGTVAGL
ncbi:hypothetical protein LTR48_007022 [Friedmanniomyces endolithicus]|nr:hypothetical protein LTR48_007022 [Friedmanniomyces endolithicus]